ncbi:cytochrome b/b6 domain-containing protein [Pseudidiomarina terrestris]|uniref:Cytochrome b/b6 domain-containing protein n=1 Tax=Pseudidiomarina terrestris TaxID=2820060 RepID=A0ABT8MI70_9GAMM|nr:MULTISPECIES: cytochrome b/b6 domain-containing protein [unclassified Pseudidiomarina]MDN7125967.1 cytochrome b/b6 domain-containing protein [Pseudidiomarina sp. 1APR75-33.1]MDN7129633.1 cytochrome b/b6 domain-containing protein [Pseudidiomarina sp. 1APR75-15]MDN7135948.1 cytochrome b/b6 domain-containing protein [Pseudidiomarina sp. 1ASP75-5]
MKSTNTGKQTTVRIWDPLIRIVHWTLVAVFIANYFFLEPGSQWHQWLGYIAVTAILVRIVWGFIDSGYGSFQRIDLSRQALRKHLNHLKERKIPVKSGHNPVGWLMIFAVISLFLGLGVTGFLMEEVDALFGNPTLELIHGWLADTLYGAALIHVAAVVIVGWRGRIQLIRPMLTGKRSKS